jgi:phosphoribosylformylglycinamidine synthase I
MTRKAKVLVLRTAGTNCDLETVFAFKSAGAHVDSVHINMLFSKKKHLSDYHILALPGGFTYGDDIAAGKILANELKLKLGDDIKKFIADGKLIIGICNGFQILVKAGILPGEGDGCDFSQSATLTINDSGKFEDRWTYLKPSGQCVWTKGIKGVVYFPVAHAEGKFVTRDNDILKTIKNNNQVVFRYCDRYGRNPDYPANPNGSIDNIAGVTDHTGRILGLMPHPERHFLFYHHPYWTRLRNKTHCGDGALLFDNGVNYIRKKFQSLS